MAMKKLNRVLIGTAFIDDVCRRCDKWMAEIKSHHGTITSDVIYKCSSAWKDCVIKYAYTGDMGGSAFLSFGHDATDIDKIVCKAFFQNLLGASEVLWELGLNMSFDAYGKHAISCHAVDVLVDEDDL